MIDWDKIQDEIKVADKLLLTTHVNPDGDGLGSSAAMFHHVKEFGKECRIITVSELPSVYKFLEKGNMFYTFDTEQIEWIKGVDLGIIFDVGDFSRLKSLGETIKKLGLKTINIDHHPHPADTPFTLDVVDVEVSAAGELVYDFLSTVRNGDISGDMWEGIYTSIMTDTGSFSYSNTSAKCHQIAIEAIQAGVDQTRIHQEIYESSSIEKMRLLSQILAGIELEENGELAWFKVNGDMMSSAGASVKDVDGFTDFVRTIDGVEVALMVFENEDHCRVNFRSKGKYVVNTIAKELGGGGHQLACGAVVKGSLEEVLPLVLEKTKSSMHSQNGQME